MRVEGKRLDSAVARNSDPPVRVAFVVPPRSPVAERRGVGRGFTRTVATRKNDNPSTARVD